ncbi:MAG: response regulator [Burkholderiaceae bacterium]|nr:response regulator [Burkholderiaceae bacterium]
MRRPADLPLRLKFLLLPLAAALLMLALGALYVHDRQAEQSRLQAITGRDVPAMRELQRIGAMLADEHVRLVSLQARVLRGELEAMDFYRAGRFSVEALHRAETELAALAPRLPDSSGGAAAVEELRGRLIAYRQEVAETVLQGSVQTLQVARFMLQANQAYEGLNSALGELVAAVQTRIADQTQALTEQRAQAQRRWFMAVGVLLAVLMGLSLGLSQLFATDLRRLLAALTRLRDGGADADRVIAALPRRRDEFGALHGLVQAFQSALQQRDQAQQALAHEAQALEQRVRSRTEDLERARAEAERANHAKSEFLSRMSHELRTPLNAILGFGQLLELQAGDDGQRARVREILHAGRHLLTLIDEVLDLARVEAGHLSVSPEPVALQPLVQDCLGLVRPAALARGVQLLEPSPLCAVHVRADRTRLKQVLLNLLSNAIKYNRPHGMVAVTCQPEPQAAGAGPAWLRIRVDDSGTGLDEAQQGRLFVPFERLDAEARQIQGTGIGLALSKRLVELMGGQIGVESAPGRGSSFWLRLPLAQAPAPPALPAPADTASAAPPRQRRHDLLCIEDNPANLRLIEQIFAHRDDLRLLTAMSPALGLELARSHRPALVLLDINLPDMDGYAVLQCLHDHAATRDIPVLAVSANAMPKDLERAKAAGFAGYVTKPLDVRELLARVDSLLPPG